MGETNEDDELRRRLATFCEAFVIRYEQKLEGYKKKALVQQRRLSLPDIEDDELERPQEGDGGGGGLMTPNLVAALLSSMRPDRVSNDDERRRRKATRIWEHFLITPADELRAILARASVEVYRCFEQQFAKLCDDSTKKKKKQRGGEENLILHELGREAAERVLAYAADYEHNDGNVGGEFLVRTYEDFETLLIDAFRVDLRKMRWSYDDMYNGVGLMIRTADGGPTEYYKKTYKDRSRKYGYRLPFLGEFKSGFMYKKVSDHDRPKDDDTYAHGLMKASDVARHARRVLDRIERKTEIQTLFYNIRSPVGGFVGRAVELKVLDDLLRRRNGTVYLCGLAGVGKTELVRKYINTYSADYDNRVFFMNAESPRALHRSFRELLVDRVGISSRDMFTGEEKTTQQIVESVYEHFRIGRLLIVFDGVESGNRDTTEWLESFLPPSGKYDNRFYTIVTSRVTPCRRNGDADPPLLRLKEFTRDESTEFIKRTIGDSDCVSELADALHDFPLALRQAADYIGRRDDCDVRRYLDDFETKKSRLLNRHGRHDYVPYYDDTAYRVIKHTVMLVEGASKTTAEILRICSVLSANKAIPRSLFGSDLAATAEDGNVTSSLVTLNDHCVIEMATNDECFTINGLVQDVVVCRMLSHPGHMEDVVFKTCRLLRTYCREQNADDVVDVIPLHFRSLLGHAGKVVTKSFGRLPLPLFCSIADSLSSLTKIDDNDENIERISDCVKLLMRLIEQWALLLDNEHRDNDDGERNEEEGDIGLALASLNSICSKFKIDTGPLERSGELRRRFNRK